MVRKTRIGFGYRPLMSAGERIQVIERLWNRILFHCGWYRSSVIVVVVTY